MVKTSYYTNYQAIQNSGLVPVRISRGSPRFRLPYELQWVVDELCPPSAIRRLPVDEFEVAYLSGLQKIGVDKIAKAMYDGCGPKIILLCFCKPQLDGSILCHRRMFADWWEEQTGELVEEL